MTPKSYTLSADGLAGRIEAVMHRDVLAQIPNRVGSMAEADVVLVPISYYGDYKFHDALLSINKPVVVFDYLEWFGFATSHLLGKEELPRNVAEDPEWQKLNRWAAEANIVLTFQRELLKKDVGERRIPIEWPNYLDLWQRESKAAFDKRPFLWLFNWGMSHYLRPKLHSQTFKMMADGRLDVISHWDHIDAKINEPQAKALSIHTPHTHRIPTTQIAVRQAQSRMCVSMPGSGITCFRSTEALVHTVPVKFKDDKAWSYDWNHGENCLILENESMMAHDLMSFAEWDLHPIYMAAQELAERYHVSNYTRNYVMPAIERAL